MVQSRVAGERKTTPVGHVLHFEDEVVRRAQTVVLPREMPTGREALQNQLLLKSKDTEVLAIAFNC